ncbi:hypothetical protein EI427_12550 [Flammeovirga pectinis]|uniref:DUF5683 domain-containing protein n=1 Tax=Flammeovirga pectinis TaxID=2494373 RepID=A0A3S9P497_9BACT|nr:DUF5683 domain-containing protein [Flammeovirga pectinis]AZQ63035.1 hypothetical protein EI427_12550 [Flammeovirga pectinis]
MLRLRNHIFYLFIFVFCFSFFNGFSSFAQTEPIPDTTEDEEISEAERNQRSMDSLTTIKAIPNHIDQKEKKRKQKIQYENLTEPTKASFYSIVIPGLGQIHNNKVWKVPILYGGFAVFGYFIKFNHSNYIQSSHWLAYKADSDPLNDNLIPEIYRNLTVENLRNRSDNFRRDRDFMIIVTCMWYMLGALDAAVDQHLKYYDISDDLSFKVSPAAIPDPLTGLPAVGMTLSLKLNSK